MSYIIHSGIEVIDSASAMHCTLYLKGNNVSEKYHCKHVDLVYDGQNFWEADNPMIMLKGRDALCARREFRRMGLQETFRS